MAPFQLFAQLYDYHATTGSITHVRNVGNEITDQDYGKDFPSSTGYDPLGRLVGAVGPWQPGSLGVSATYAYDAIGNMVTKDQVASYPPASKTLKYEHATSPHAVTKLTTGDGVVKNYAYDANGNLLQRIVGGTMENFEWDQDNRLLRMRQGSSSALREFVYDYTGERVKASSASSGLFYTPSRDFDWDGTGSANLYVFLGATRVATFGLAFSPPPVSGGVSVDWEELGRGLGALGLGLWPFLAMLLGLALTRWWMDPRRAPIPVLAKRAGVGVLVLAVLHATAGPAHAIAPPYAGHWGLTLYYHADYKGSTSVVYDAQRNGQQALDYWPYGAVRGNLNNGYVDVRHKFTGQELDNFLGLYYYGGRWYDPETGRFISPDPYVQDPENPQALNRYSYVANNPTNLVDPSGHSWVDIVIGVVSPRISDEYQAIRAGIESRRHGNSFLTGYFREELAQATGRAASNVGGLGGEFLRSYTSDLVRGVNSGDAARAAGIRVAIIAGAAVAAYLGVQFLGAAIDFFSVRVEGNILAGAAPYAAAGGAAAGSVVAETSAPDTPSKNPFKPKSPADEFWNRETDTHRQIGKALKDKGKPYATNQWWLDPDIQEDARRANWTRRTGLHWSQNLRYPGPPDLHLTRKGEQGYLHIEKHPQPWHFFESTLLPWEW